eukprot:gnl/MRDRNA2_/MRDRNA2_173422_c0_seq1.p1 gnl/MRDRNA2_/MRDRNA2_173422_c0~~gnl/MRDRNA2_/MRDRNA2_173422_c0_seq1.p1  ORF type:complete len:753 (+),score=118.22 gnl/MRDRNA2_/MRDRNA2_173422_c0_seq1:171-2429(+)
MIEFNLKNSSRPIANGEFLPRLTPRGQRQVLGNQASSRSATSSHKLPDITQGGFRSTASTFRATPRAANTPRSLIDKTPRGFADLSSSRLGTSTQKRNASKSFHDYQVFSNGNSYEGSWFDGQMQGEGHYKWIDGSEYVGQFHEGCMWGYGEKKCLDGRVCRGEWRKDKMWGEGEVVWPSGESYAGQFRKGVFHGKGTRIWPSGDKYTGDFRNGNEEGRGVFWSALEGWSYVGQWLHGQMSGEGAVRWPNEIQYEGQWQNSQRHGFGRLSWPEGSVYEGQFAENCIAGRGKKVLTDGSWYEGQFENGAQHGEGKFHWPDGTEFEGIWHLDGIVGPGCHRFPGGLKITACFGLKGATGEGAKQYPDGSMYTGTLLNNMICNYGSFTWPDGRCYVGHFQDENMHGEGVLTWSDGEGECKYSGKFAQNQFHGQGVLEWSSTAKYVGQFQNGLYHGDGSFTWPNNSREYHGSFSEGQISGMGFLKNNIDDGSSDSYMYAGEFLKGHLHGRGALTFTETGDQYVGEFKYTSFSGAGSFSWRDGASLSGNFVDNSLTGQGKKVWPGHVAMTKKVYVGQMVQDIEEGEGSLMEEGKCFSGTWKAGRMCEKLAGQTGEVDLASGQKLTEAADSPKSNESTVPPFAAPPDRKMSAKTEQVHHQNAAQEFMTRTGSRWWTSNGRQANQLISGPDGGVLDGKAVVLFKDGDKYIGNLKRGKKHGEGMYVYADLTVYSGIWEDDVLAGIYHPIIEKDQVAELVQ